MSFHVVLPSSSSMTLYPENTLSNYCVKLAKPIVLNQPYLVALEEFIYPQMHKRFEQHEVYIDIMTINGSSDEVKRRIWLDLSSEEDASAIIGYLNHELGKHGWVLAHSDTNRNKLYFEYMRDETIPFDSLRLHPKLAYLLGFSRAMAFAMVTMKKEEAMRECLLYDYSHQMFVYADLVDHQRVGDTLVPLLRICVMEPSRGKLVSEKYIKPYYALVCKSHIEEIRIQVRNHSGEPFPFPSSAPLIVKLHFKPA